jgi:hypothetical protein
MTAITRGERAFYAIVALSALWIGSWCYVVPAYVRVGMPWNAPPLHARFLGAIYLSATTFCLCSAFARTRAQLRAVLPMIAIWTGVVLVVSFFYLTQADYLRGPVWIWLLAYLVYPLIALRLMWIHRNEPNPAATRALPRWAQGYLLVQGILLSAAALLLLLLPQLMIKAWPWKLTQQLAQIYSGPILCYGVASVLISRAASFAQVRIAITGMLVFALAVLVASVIHRAVFAHASLSANLWFAGFAIATAILGLMMARSWHARE